LGSLQQMAIKLFRKLY